MTTKNLLAGGATVLALLILAPFAMAFDFVRPGPDTDASVHIVHGIPGEDLGFDHEMPVDLAVNGTCILRGMSFGQIQGPLSFASGVHQFNFSHADQFSACANSGDPLAVLQVDMTDGGPRSVVLHLDAAGNAEATAFHNDLTNMQSYESRPIVHHTAAAPMVDVTLRTDRQNVMGLACVQMINGDQCAGEVRWGVWTLTIGPPSSHEILYGPQSLLLRPWYAALLYVVGSVEHDTLTVLSKQVMVRRKVSPYWPRRLDGDTRSGTPPAKIRPGS